MGRPSSVRKEWSVFDEIRKVPSNNCHSVTARSNPRPKGPATNLGPKSRHFAPPEVKLLAMEGREARVSIEELAELANVSATTINKWWSIYKKGGTAAPCRKPSTAAANRQCRALNERIVARSGHNSKVNGCDGE